MSQFLRPSILAMTGYTPGEQPREEGIIKLNTNENPYPPSPRALAAMAGYLTNDRLRKYPDPLGQVFRQSAGRVLGVDPDAILIGNGSDDILTILTRAFVPENGLVVSPTPSYLLYRTLAQLQGARFETIPFTAEWKLPRPWPLPRANLTLVANPNSPTGTVISNADLESLAHELHGPLVVDEAYVDFAQNSALPLLQSASNNVIITRTLSKSYSLAGLRFGFGIAAPELIHHLNKVKDSYNCDVLSLACAAAALEDQDYMRQTRSKILATRARLEKSLAGFGFTVLPSQANFVWARRSDRPVKPIFEELKRRRILVRYMNYDGYDGLRISIGTDQELDRLLEELRSICVDEKVAMIRVILPYHLRNLAQVDAEVTLEIAGPVTQRAVLDALENRYPTLRGTIRDHGSVKRRPMLRFFACEQDLSNEPPDAPLPEAVAAGKEPFFIVGAVAGG